ncbi:unnamed protein product [Lasius platythorax]|uniref:Retrovirus-related pol polyprotein from transposon tnt 1-94 n=2 Tax=Lasius TaxID=488720 RepID=A0A0J7K664_LASNI|nr:retrovirus-related pol polyprotein from transposon tnt 1-94 [Lasius niger]
MTGHTVNIEKLNKENFDTWKLQIGAILIKNDHWAYVNGTKPAPELEIAEDNVTNAAEIEAWETADQKARADIILAMSPSELCHIKHCTTSNEVWRKLEEVYHSRGMVNRA